MRSMSKIPSMFHEGPRIDAVVLWHYPAPACQHPEIGNQCQCDKGTQQPVEQEVVDAPGPIYKSYAVKTPRWECTIHVNESGKIVRREGQLRRDFWMHRSWHSLAWDIRRQVKSAEITMIYSADNHER